ncbi:MAG: VOC family protein [Halobacteriota archaeon]
MVENVIHTSLWVSDVERTEAFYVDALGLRRTREQGGSAYQEGVQNVFVAGPNGIEIQFKHASGQDPDPPAGFDHVAVSTVDVDAEFERIVEETGCPVVMEPTTIGSGARIAFVEDPDGYAVELVQR